MRDLRSEILRILIISVLVAGSYFTFQLLQNAEVWNLKELQYWPVFHKALYHLPSPPVGNSSSIRYTYTSRDGAKHTSERMFPLQYAAEAFEVTHYVDLHKVNYTDFNFVTGASSNHFIESRDMVASIQHNFPQKKIYYYDLGLTQKQLQTLSTWCNVIVRQFNFSRYPPHVKQLASYAFKPIIIHELLQEEEAILWADASIRIINNDTVAWNQVYVVANNTGGISQLSCTTWNTFQCTHKGMYRYLAVNEEKLEKYPMFQATVVLYYRTEIIMKQVIYWHRLCALTKECIQPIGHILYCNAKMKNKAGVSTCHRYDQSALNILTANMLDYNWNSLISKGKQVISVIRAKTNTYETRLC